MLNHDNDAGDVVVLSAETVMLGCLIQTTSWQMRIFGQQASDFSATTS
jgi:hypothetical protein